MAKNDLESLRTWFVASLLVCVSVTSLACFTMSQTRSRDTYSPIFKIEYNLAGSAGIVEILTITSEGHIDLFAPNLRRYRESLNKTEKSLLLPAIRSRSFGRSLSASLAKGKNAYDLEYVVFPLADKGVRVPVGDVSDGVLEMMEIIDDVASRKFDHYLKIADRMRLWREGGVSGYLQ